MSVNVGARYEALGGSWKRFDGSVITPPVDPTEAAFRMFELEMEADGSNVTPVIGWDWSDSNQPWAFSNISEVTAGMPAGTNIVDLNTSGTSDFYTQLQNTMFATAGRVVIRLPAGIFRFTSFRLIGSSGDPTYSFGYWHSRLAGFLGAGAHLTFVEMAANSMSAAQLTNLSQKTVAAGSPNQMGMMRVDGTGCFFGALTFRAADQQLLTSVASDLGQWNVYTPQPAPHQGVVFFSGAQALVSHVRFQGAGRAMTSAPPFEMANATSQRGDIYWRHCEFDGRRSPDLNPARPKRCSTWMGNNEIVSKFEDCWLHHSNVSRYAANDQNQNTQGAYILTRTKVEQITTDQNRDPAINGGASLGGYTNATLLGWESSNATLTLTDCILSVDNPATSPTKSRHLQFTTVTRNPSGGRLYVIRGEFRNTAWPWLDGYTTVSLDPATYWRIDGLNTTMDVRDASNVRKTPYDYTGSWPPSAATLAGAGVTPATHFIVSKV